MSFPHKPFISSMREHRLPISPRLKPSWSLASRSRRHMAKSDRCRAFGDVGRRLQTAHALWSGWGGVSATPPTIETSDRPMKQGRMRRKRGLVSLSGGVDGLHTLMHNHRLYRRSDPAYIQAALVVHGFDLGKRARSPEEDRWGVALQLIQSVASEAGVDIITCRTNLRHLPEKPGFWTYRQNAAALAAAAYASVSFPAYFYIASTYQLAHMIPMGSHPALDIHYSDERLNSPPRRCALH